MMASPSRALQIGKVGWKVPGLLHILLFIALDHQLVQHDQIVAGQRLDWLEAQRFDRLPLLVDPHQPISTPDAVDSLRVLWTADI